MPLVKSPRMTAAKLAANRANARKSTGPRTPQGKRHVILNALKHGRYARTEKLAQSQGDSGLVRWIRSQITAFYQPQGERGEQAADLMTRQVWCTFAPGRKERQQELAKGWRLPTQTSLWSMGWVPDVGTKPRYAVKSVDAQVTSSLFPLQVRIQHPRDPRQMVFWVRARRDTVTLSLGRLLKMAEKALEALEEEVDSGKGGQQ